MIAKLIIVGAALFQIMSAAQIGALITARAEKGATPATLYNLGFELYYRHGFSPRQMAENIAKGYQSASGFTPQQRIAIEKAAAFWQRELSYFSADVLPDRSAPPHRYAPAIDRPGHYRDPPLAPLTPTPRKY